MIIEKYLIRVFCGEVIILVRKDRSNHKGNSLFSEKFWYHLTWTFLLFCSSSKMWHLLLHVRHLVVVVIQSLLDLFDISPCLLCPHLLKSTWKLSSWWAEHPWLWFILDSSSFIAMSIHNLIIQSHCWCIFYIKPNLQPFFQAIVGGFLGEFPQAVNGLLW